MNTFEVDCPCCREKLIIEIVDGVVDNVFFYVQNSISEEDLFYEHGICLGEKGFDVI